MPRTPLTRAGIFPIDVECIDPGVLRSQWIGYGHIAAAGLSGLSEQGAGHDPLGEWIGNIVLGLFEHIENPDSSPGRPIPF